MQDGRALRLCIIFGIFASYLTLSQSKVNSTCWELPLADDEWIPKYFWRHYVPRETSIIISGVVSSLDEHGQICIRRQWLTAPGTPQDKRPHNKTTEPIYSPGTKFSEFLALIPCSIKASMSETSIAHFCKHPTNIVRPFLAPKGTTRYFHREPIQLVHRQPKRTKVRCQYYANATANRQILLLGGDISRNPGPARQQTANNKAQPKFGSNPEAQVSVLWKNSPVQPKESHFFHLFHPFSREMCWSWERFHRLVMYRLPNVTSAIS